MEIQLDNTPNQTIIDIDNRNLTLTTNLGDNDYGRGNDSTTSSTTTTTSTT